MNKESKLNLNAGDYAISHCDSDKTYNGLEVHKMLCDAYIAGNNDTLDDEDEKIKEAIIATIHLYYGEPLEDEAKEMIAWLEKQGETFTKKDVDDAYLKGISDAKNELEKQGEQKTEENKGNLGGISPNWSEADKNFMYDTLSNLAELKDRYGESYGNVGKCIDWLLSLKDRVQPKQEWSEEDEQILQGIWDEILANKHDAKECEWKTYDKFLDWLKSLRPQNTYNPYKAVVESIAEMCKHYDKASHSGLRDFYDNVKVKCKDAKEYDKMFPQTQWKPSDEQIGLLQAIINEPNNAASESCQIILKDILEQLKKLKEE